MTEPAAPTEPTAPIRVALVDDQQLVRAGLRMVLESQPDIVVVAEASDGAAALIELGRVRADVVLMDVRLPDKSGVSACREIRDFHRATRVIFLTSFTDDTGVMETILGGADGYLLKRVNATALSRAVHTVAAGQTILDPMVRDAVMTRVDRAGFGPDAASSGP